MHTLKDTVGTTHAHFSDTDAMNIILLTLSNAIVVSVV